jgi:hypothetical protein
MSLDASDLIAIEQIVHRALSVRPQPSPVRIAARLTVVQFACCIQRSPETVRRDLRANIHGIRTKGLAEGNPWMISPKALALYAVDVEMAVVRLTEAGLMPERAGSHTKAAPSPQPSPA